MKHYYLRASIFCVLNFLGVVAMGQGHIPEKTQEAGEKKIVDTRTVALQFEDGETLENVPLEWLKQSPVMQDMCKDLGNNINRPLSLQLLIKIADFKAILPTLKLLADPSYKTKEAKEEALTEQCASYKWSDLISLLNAMHSNRMVKYLDVSFILKIATTVCIERIVEQLSQPSENYVQEFIALIEEIKKLNQEVQLIITKHLKKDIQYFSKFYNTRTTFKTSTSLFDYHNCMSAAISPDGKYIVGGLDNGSIRLLDVRDAGRVTILKNVQKYAYYFGAQVTSVKFSPNGQYVLSKLRNGAIELWNINNCQKVISFSSISLADKAEASFSATSKYVVFKVCKSGNLLLWNIENCIRAQLKERVKSIIIKEGKKEWLDRGGWFTGKPEYHVLTFSFDGTRINESYGYIPGPSCWYGDALDVSNEDSVKSLFVEAPYRNGKHLLKDDYGDKEIDEGTFVQQERQKIEHTFLKSCNISIDKDYKSAINFHDVGTDELIFSLFSTSSVNSLKISPDGKQIVAGSNKQTITVWDIESLLKAFEVITLPQIILLRAVTTSRELEAPNLTMADMHKHSSLNAIVASLDPNIQKKCKLYPLSSFWEKTKSFMSADKVIGYGINIGLACAAAYGIYKCTGSMTSLFKAIEKQ